MVYLIFAWIFCLHFIKIIPDLLIVEISQIVREAAKKFFFCGPVTERGGGYPVQAFVAMAIKKKNFYFAASLNKKCTLFIGNRQIRKKRSDKNAIKRTENYIDYQITGRKNVEKEKQLVSYMTKRKRWKIYEEKKERKRVNLIYSDLCCCSHICQI